MQWLVRDFQFHRWELAWPCYWHKLYLVCNGWLWRSGKMSFLNNRYSEVVEAIIQASPIRKDFCTKGSQMALPTQQMHTVMIQVHKYSTLLSSLAEPRESHLHVRGSLWELQVIHPVRVIILQGQVALKTWKTQIRYRRHHFNMFRWSVLAYAERHIQVPGKWPSKKPTSHSWRWATTEHHLSQRSVKNGQVGETFFIWRRSLTYSQWQTSWRLKCSPITAAGVTVQRTLSMTQWVCTSEFLPGW